MLAAAIIAPHKKLPPSGAPINAARKTCRRPSRARSTAPGDRSPCMQRAPYTTSHAFPFRIYSKPGERSERTCSSRTATLRRVARIYTLYASSAACAAGATSSGSTHTVTRPSSESVRAGCIGERLLPRASPRRGRRSRGPVIDDRPRGGHLEGDGAVRPGAISGTFSHGRR